MHLVKLHRIKLHRVKMPGQRLMVRAAVRQDRAAHDLPPGDPRPARLTRSSVISTPDLVRLDLPQLSWDQPARRPMVAP